MTFLHKLYINYQFTPRPLLSYSWIIHFFLASYWHIKTASSLPVPPKTYTPPSLPILILIVFIVFYQNKTFLLTSLLKILPGLHVVLRRYSKILELPYRILNGRSLLYRYSVLYFLAPIFSFFQLLILTWAQFFDNSVLI